jgi:hypothetical protein
MNRMNSLSQWGPSIFTLIAIGIAQAYNHKRLDDFRDFFKDLLRSEISGSEARLRTEIVASEARIRTDLAKLDTRVERLEEHRLVRP